MSRNKKSKKQKKQNKTKSKRQRPQSGIQLYKLELTFASPFITQASGVKALGVDAAMLKDANNTPVISGSLIRGNICHTLKYFQSILLEDKHLKEFIQNWFGETSDNSQQDDPSYKPKRAQLDFSFHWKLENKNNYTKHQGQRTRIALEKDTGTVKDGALQVIEDCFPLGSKNPVFIGVITLRYKNKTDKKAFEKWFKKALAYIPAMGSFKGVGFGRLDKAVLSDKPPFYSSENASENNTDIPNDCENIGLRLTLNSPFCLGRPVTPVSNFIVSKDYITGSVIKGLIARMYQNNPTELQNKLAFDDMIITHALPVPNTDRNQRPTPPAHSLVIEKGNTLVDLSEKTQEELTNYQPEEAPKFQIDWKASDWNSHATTPKPKRLLSLRTEINAKNQTSKEGKLFSLECIEPTGFSWCANINLTQIDENKRKQVLNNLKQCLKDGLHGIGKTKAYAHIELLPEPFPLSTKEEALNDQDSFYCIKLVTEARMLPANLQIAGTNSDAALHKAYQDYFTKIDSDIELQTNYFARQTLRSAYYHLKMNEQTIENYYPEWLTEAGSVFIVKANSDKALQALNHCAKNGLMAHNEVNGDISDWKTTPFIPQNGYGECSITKQGAS